MKRERRKGRISIGDCTDRWNYKQWNRNSCGNDTVEFLLERQVCNVHTYVVFGLLSSLLNRIKAYDAIESTARISFVICSDCRFTTYSSPSFKNLLINHTCINPANLDRGGKAKKAFRFVGDDKAKDRDFSQRIILKCLFCFYLLFALKPRN
ncbi:hypothetical protein CI610_02437 [invertebrate metagenome]|uniref:Uncharacterized protein n=1 Tax=invertebrate metagenome TaxID=1711999 RepID=A0A2H9T5Z4_9ZZZZ